ncbi:hypothetical protein [Bradyrhizobium sp. Rc2d]|uniref:hypothetical protein n=1 Tax=Bradyrhizobium sp. Rc2d TaxID=1855321 RepID=UPI001160084A|nr:hypothetical protein [Bradyrhizobium sp. Rc2d]
MAIAVYTLDDRFRTLLSYRSIVDDALAPVGRREAARCADPESLLVAHKTGAIGPKDLKRVAIPRCSPRPVAHPTNGRLMRRAINHQARRARQAQRRILRQICLCLAKRAAITVGRYIHAHQFERAPRQLKLLLARLARIIRRNIDGDAVLEAR